MDIHHCLYVWPNSLTRLRAKGYVGNEMTVHYVDMNIVRSCASDSADFVTQRRKVCGKDGRSDSDRFLHGV